MKYFLLVNVLLLHVINSASTSQRSNGTDSFMPMAAQNYHRSVDERIQHGSPEGTDNYNYVVKIYLWDNEHGYTYCSGILIHRQWALTAARCAEFNPQQYYVYYSEPPKSGGYYIEGERFILSPGYRIPDLALIKLKEEIAHKEESYIATIPRPDRDPLDNELRSKGTPTLLVAGYGATAGHGVQIHMMQGGMTVDGKCNEMRKRGITSYLDGLPETIVCLKESGKHPGKEWNTCDVDQGGPLIFQTMELKFLVVGVINFDNSAGSNGCGGEQYERKKGEERKEFGYGTRIAPHFDWIESTLKKSNHQLKTN